MSKLKHFLFINLIFMVTLSFGAAVPENNQLNIKQDQLFDLCLKVASGVFDKNSEKIFKQIKELIKTGQVDLNQPKDGQTLLETLAKRRPYFAKVKTYDTLVSILLNNGARFELGTKLHYVIQGHAITDAYLEFESERSRKTFYSLMEKKLLDVDEKNYAEDTVLCQALQSYEREFILEILNYMEKNGTTKQNLDTVNFPNSEGSTPLGLAVFLDEEDIVGQKDPKK